MCSVADLETISRGGPADSREGVGLGEVLSPMIVVLFSNIMLSQTNIKSM